MGVTNAAGKFNFLFLFVSDLLNSSELSFIPTGYSEYSNASVIWHNLPHFDGSATSTYSFM
jgi:hypothetical protein